MRRVSVCLIVLTLLAVVTAAPAAHAQEAAGTYIVQIRTGACDAPGDGLAQLGNLTYPASGTVGAPAASAATSSYSVAPLSLNALIGTNTAVFILDATNNTLVACGEIGGIIGNDGALAIGLRPMNNSGFTGIAYLSPNGSQTGVSTFLAPTGATSGGGSGGSAAPVDPETYASMINSQLTVLVGSLQRIDSLFGNPNASDSNWVSQVGAELFLWKLLYRVAQDVTPPADFASFDEQYLGALALLDGAATDIMQALQTSDEELLSSASGKIQEAITALRSLQSNQPSATPAAGD